MSISEIVWAVITLLLGFVFLIKGADLFVAGSSSVAKKMRVPSMIIGMTIVAMGTSLPECAVSVTAALNHKNSLAISNVVGSNIFNLMVVCGMCALFVPLAVQVDTLKKEFPFSILCAILLLVLGYIGMSLGRIDGVIFCVIFVAFLIWMVRSAVHARNSAQVTDPEVEEMKILPVWKCSLFILIGIVGIALGGDWVVDGASVIASAFSLSQTLIGLTVVALGTSLPELVTSIVAARRNEVDMALGNVIGSNIFNILLVLGVAATISPIEFIAENMIDIIILLLMSGLVWVFAWTKKNIGRVEGAVMLSLYVIYVVYIIMR